MDGDYLEQQQEVFNSCNRKLEIGYGRAYERPESER